tara:strand:+ start:231 stop:596 length:366 start_codon:yes stop_codon:yes gene_type:complete
MSWFEIVKETVETHENYCCHALEFDVKKYIIGHFSDRGYLSKDSYEHLFGNDCDEVLQTLEDIKIDGTMMYMNKKFGMRGWNPKIFSERVLEEIQEVSKMVLNNWEECSLDEQTVEMSNEV